MKKIILSSSALLTFLVCFAGVMRDDVPESAYTDLANQKQFECVGRVFNQDKAIGSCVLIGKRYVLTAAHILMNYTTRPDSSMFATRRIVLYRPVAATPLEARSCRFEFAGKSYYGKSIRIADGYQWQTQTLDLAIIELEEAATVAPAILNTRTDELGSVVVGVGFGASGPGGRPQAVVAAGKKIAGQNSIDSLGGKDRTMLVCDFDHPNKPELNRIGSAAALPLEYSCNGGDSGGGMFRQRDGRWELVGICHSAEAGMNTLLKNGYYGLLMEYMRVSSFYNWIKQNTRS